MGEFQLDASAKAKQISKVFDPLGLYFPVSSKGKLLMRELWATKLEWDDVIPDETLKKWFLHCTDLNSLSTVFFSKILCE